MRYYSVVFRWLTLLLLITACDCLLSQEIGDADRSVPTVQARPSGTAKIRVALCILTEEESLVGSVLTVVERDFTFSGQLEVLVKKYNHRPSKKDVTSLFSEGIPLALFITNGPMQDNSVASIEWRLFDTMQGTMIGGKRCLKRGDSVTGWAHHIADSVWPTLTSSSSFFSTKIAYCKQLYTMHGKRITQVCIADYDGGNEQVIVDAPTIHVAPRWNNDKNRPLLFYSEYTSDNVRLMFADIITRKRYIALNNRGIAMVPAFSGDGKKIVYCASQGDGACQLYYGQNGVFDKITNNQGNNIAPTLFPDGSAIVFCSDFQTGQPQIYQYTVASGLIERITTGGYCASPSYSSTRHQVAYVKMDNGTMQVYLYDCASKVHSRLTGDSGNKEECSWSPCGNYLVFAIENGRKSRLAVLNMLTHETKYITSADYSCTYPSWSPRYNIYL